MVRYHDRYCVVALGFTFRFTSLGHLEQVLNQFKNNGHRGGEGCWGHHGEHYVQHPWAKLPLWLKNKRGRPKVIKALEAALIKFMKNPQKMMPKSGHW